jgi:hypothetical protein
VGIEVLTAVVTKSPIFWDITPCSTLKVNRSFVEHVTSIFWLLHDGFFLGLLFDPDDGGDMFLRNVG